MNRLPRLIVPSVLALLAACASLGLEHLDFNGKAAAAQKSLTSVVQGTDALLAAHVISSADAQNVLDQSHLADQGISLAKTYEADGDPKTAQQKLTSSLAVLTALEIYVSSQQKPKGDAQP